MSVNALNVQQSVTVRKRSAELSENHGDIIAFARNGFAVRFAGNKSEPDSFVNSAEVPVTLGIFIVTRDSQPSYFGHFAVYKVAVFTASAVISDFGGKVYGYTLIVNIKNS